MSFKFKTPDFGGLSLAMSKAEKANTPSPMSQLAVSAGLMIGGIAAQAAENRRQKQVIGDLADQMEQTDPESANVYRTMADSIPLIDLTSLTSPSSGAARGVRAGGTSMSPVTSSVMESMLQKIKDDQRQKNELAVIAARKGAEVEIEKIKAKLKDELDQSHAERSQDLERLRQDGRGNLLEAQNDPALLANQLKQRDVVVRENNSQVAQERANLESEKLKQAQTEFEAKKAAGALDAPAVNADANKTRAEAAALKALDAINNPKPPTLTEKQKFAESLKDPVVYSQWKDRVTANINELKRTNTRGKNDSTLAKMQQEYIEVEALRSSAIKDKVADEIGGSLRRIKSSTGESPSSMVDQFLGNYGN